MIESNRCEYHCRLGMPHSQNISNKVRASLEQKYHAILHVSPLSHGAPYYPQPSGSAKNQRRLSEPHSGRVEGKIYVYIHIYIYIYRYLDTDISLDIDIE